MKPSRETARHCRKLALSCFRQAIPLLRWLGVFWVDGLCYRRRSRSGVYDCSDGRSFRNIFHVCHELQQDVTRGLLASTPDVVSMVLVQEYSVFRALLDASYWRQHARGEEPVDQHSCDV